MNAIAKKFKGFKAGAENGERGYFLTFMIGYLRDFGFRYNFIAESFETSLPWKDVSKMCSAVSKRISNECKRHGIKKEPFLSSRVTQVLILLCRSMILELLSIFTLDLYIKDLPTQLPYMVKSKMPQETKS
jgi:hypothetical protein